MRTVHTVSNEAPTPNDQTSTGREVWVLLALPQDPALPCVLQEILQQEPLSYTPDGETEAQEAR